MTTKKRILVVEDEQISGTLYQAYLEGAGFEVIRYEEPPLKDLDQLKVDLVVLDLYTPQSTAWEVVPTYRRVWSQNRVPILILSAESRPGMQAQFLSLGADEFLVKAEISGGQLVQRVRYWLSRGAIDDKAHARRKPPSLLVVDADPTVSMIISGYTRQAEVVVEAATSATGCLDTLDANRQNPPLAILIGSLASNQDVFDLVRSLGDRQCQVPLVFMSGAAASYVPAAIEIGRKAGLRILPTIRKPIDGYKLRELVATLRQARA